MSVCLLARVGAFIDSIVRLTMHRSTTTHTIATTTHTIATATHIIATTTSADMLEHQDTIPFEIQHPF